MSGDTLTVTSTDTNTQLTQEQVEDFVGGMVTGNTETGITVTYQDADGTLDFEVSGASALAADDLTIGDAAVSVATTVGNITIDAQANDADVIIKVDDAGASVTAVTFDGSEAGAATFNSSVAVGGAVTGVTALNGGQIGGSRNLVDNGALKVAQRGAQVTGLGADATVYTLDRWCTLASGTAGRFTMDQASDGPAGFANCLKITTTTADTSIATGEYFILEQRIEGQDLQQLQKGTATAKQLTVSFYVKGNASAVYVCELQDWDNGRIITQSFAVTTAWNRIELTFAADTSDPLDDDNASSFSLNFWLHAGATYTGGTFAVNTWADYGDHSTRYAVAGRTSIFDATSRTFSITGVQMEIGTTATDFEHRTYAEELAKCQRYYTQQATMNYGYPSPSTGGYAARQIYLFPVTMRAAPTVTATYSYQNNTGSTSQDAATVIGYSVQYVATGHYNITWGHSHVASAEL